MVAEGAAGMSSLKEFQAQIDKWLEDTEAMTARVARGLAVEVFKGAIHNTPTYSGDMMANWMLEVGKVTPTFTPLRKVDNTRNAKGQLARFGIEAHKTNIPTADMYGTAAIRNTGNELQVMKLGPPIYIHNSASHDQNYAWMIEENTDGEGGTFYFRPQNEGKYAPGKKAVQAVALKYASIGKVQALALSNNIIGSV